jgi:succinoglycan biosynthesis protein ExoO
MMSLSCLRETAIRYDERLRIGEDYELIVRLMAAGHKMRLEPGAHYRYRKHSESISHRMRAPAIEALIEANMRLQRDIDPTETEVQRAIRKRDLSLQAMLSYDRVIELIKAQNYARAASISLKQPRIWPLLSRPIQARISRLMKGAARVSPPITRHPPPVAH